MIIDCMSLLKYTSNSRTSFPCEFSLSPSLTPTFALLDLNQQISTQTINHRIYIFKVILFWYWACDVHPFVLKELQIEVDLLGDRENYIYVYE
ncbi:hypothetical protein L1887_21005 [Cichorium endivia]|nr:hypothetical protein L1887_21005 [Cichorium endivia]